jgi:hypothetical protein
VSTALAMEPRSVQIVAGLDEAQVCAAFELHREWAREEGRELDEEAWATDIRAKIDGGQYNVGIAWDGNKAVGVSEIVLAYDAMTQTTSAYAERSYVLPEYRRSDITVGMAEMFRHGAKWLGATSMRIVTLLDKTGRFMQAHHEKCGFKPVATVLQMEIE